MIGYVTYMHIFLLFPVLVYVILCYFAGRNFSSNVKFIMAIASIIIILSHAQDAGFLKPKPTFFIFGHDVFTAFRNLPWKSQCILVFSTLLSSGIFYMIL